MLTPPMVSMPSPSRRVLACDDEPQILRALKVILRDAGYTVLTAESMDQALDLAAVPPVDAAIVDLVLPDGDGLELCERLREWSDMPIIVLSAIGDEDQKVSALNAGADDYITKPFGPRDLLARLEAVLRRASPEAEENVIAADGLEIDLAAHVVRRDGDEVHLTPTEFELLRVLVRNRGRLMTHRALLAEVWGPGYTDDNHVLRTHIARLRRKIDPPDAPQKQHIRTEPGVGFRFDPR
jgi:two-component system, OmpR family, KDP operon response regulator KdpE